MERKIFNAFLQWKKDINRKVMLLYGPCGCGKSYAVLDFGKKEYKNAVYFDATNNLELNYVLDKNTTPEKVIRGLAAISLESILPNDTLIIFDNVNEEFLNKIRKLFANYSLHHIIMITNNKSLTDIKKIEGLVVKNMSYVSFPEYLKYIGKEQLIDFIIDSFKTNTPMPFHAMAFEAFNDYVITGGYPEAIVNFGDTNILNNYHGRNSLLQKNMLLSLDNLIDIRRGVEVYDSVYYQLLKENKKFQYGLLKQGARSKEYDGSIDFMVNNDLLLKSYKVNDIESPLSKHREVDSFKLYYTDSGILFKKLGIHYNKLLVDSKMLYLLYENNIATTLVANGFNLYYHQSGGKSEIDFVIQTRTGKLIPIELVRKDMAKSKSLKLTINKYDLKEAIRFSEDNFSVKNSIKYVPFYAIFCVTDVM